MFIEGVRMMNKLLMCFMILALTSGVASATVVGLIPPGPITLNPSDTIEILIGQDGLGLLGFNPLITVDGEGCIVHATGVAESAGFGWDPSYSFDPTPMPGPHPGTNAVEIGMGNFSGNFNNIIGSIIFHCDGGPGWVHITMVEGITYGGSADMNFMPPIYDGITIDIWQTPEPMSIALLGLGGLFLRRRR
jgi:hypothetical protein